MASVFVRLKVADYDQFKQAFDNAESFRRENGGVTGHSLHRDADDPNWVMVAARVSDLARAREFYDSDELRQRMQAGGVQDRQLWFTEDVEDKKY
jgi:hypothetical protein